MVLGFIVLLYLVGECSCTGSADGNGSGSTAPDVRVKNSAWDGSVSQVKSWLKDNLKDPDSLDFIEWSTVSKTSTGGCMVRVKYRAKNSFGGYVVDNKVFFLSSGGTVLSSIDF